MVKHQPRARRALINHDVMSKGRAVIAAALSSMVIVVATAIATVASAAAVIGHAMIVRVNRAEIRVGIKAVNDPVLGMNSAVNATQRGSSQLHPL